MKETMRPVFQTYLFRASTCGAIILVAGLVVLTACQKKEEPLKVGFVGCLTGRSAGLGVAGRDGFLLAINEANASGGISGQQILPFIHDNASNTENSAQLARELIDERVSFVVGPMISQIALGLVPVLNEKEIPMISPTVSTNKLIGLDDYFFRVYYSNYQAAVRMADHIAKRRLKKIVALYDTSNRAYTEDWVQIFERSFAANGRKVLAVPFDTSKAISFYDLVASVVKENPDGLLILASSIDTALICQQAMKIKMMIPKFATGWSYSDNLINFGGNSVEGLTVVQSVNFREGREETRRFLAAYREAFLTEPTFPAVHAYDATRLALQALKTKEQGKSLKQSMLSIRDFPGILQDFSLDEYGDVINPAVYFMQIDHAAFHNIAD